METKNGEKYLATKTVNWSGATLDMCDRHAGIARVTGVIMGECIVITLAKEDGVCANCLNEDKSK